MVDDACQSREVFSALSVRTVVEFLLVNRRVKVRVEACQGSKEAMTEVTLISVSVGVVCPLSGRIGWRPMPFQELLADDAVGVTSANGLIEAVAVERCLGTAALL